MTFINLQSSSLTIIPKYSTFVMNNNTIVFKQKHNTIANATTVTNGSIPLSNIISLPPGFSYFVEIYYYDPFMNITNITCGTASVTKSINVDEGYACATFDLQGSSNSSLAIITGNTVTANVGNSCFVIVWQLGGI